MFLDTKDNSECYGCEACKQICPKNAISMVQDDEEFRYPVIDYDLCIECGLCRGVCPNVSKKVEKNNPIYVYGGFNNNEDVRFLSTSGGAFSAIVDAFCDDNYVIFGAEADRLRVYHSYIINKKDIGKYRKSKYSQSIIGDSFVEVKRFLMEGKKVIFSGTPCQIAGLKAFLSNSKFDSSQLLTVEVVCEGVPSPLYIKKYNEYIIKKYNSPIEALDYRYSGKGLLSQGKWDFQQMHTILENGKHIVKDRWFNPFWSIWLQHLMSRPSCYSCQFASVSRVADITLGDLWGVHLYCPELYGQNGGASLVCCNTDLGKEFFLKATRYMDGHTLIIDEAIKYQSPLRKTIDYNQQRISFMMDLKNKDISFEKINKKWAIRPSMKLLFEKYIYGNRQKIFIWTIKMRLGLLRGKKDA